MPVKFDSPNCHITTEGIKFIDCDTCIWTLIIKLINKLLNTG